MQNVSMWNVCIKILHTTWICNKNGKTNVYIYIYKKRLDRTLDSSSSDENLVLIMFSTRKERRFWVDSLLQSRDRKGDLHLLTEGLKLYCMYFRMPVGQLEALLQLLVANLRRPTPCSLSEGGELLLLWETKPSLLVCALSCSAKY